MVVVGYPFLDIFREEGSKKSHNDIASNLQVGEQETVIRRIDMFVTFCLVVCHGSQPGKPGVIASQPSKPGLLALDFQPDQSWGVSLSKTSSSPLK